MVPVRRHSPARRRCGTSAGRAARRRLPEAGAEQPAAGGPEQAAAARGARVRGAGGPAPRGSARYLMKERPRPWRPAGPLLGQVGVVRGHFLGLVDLELGVELLQLVLGTEERAGVGTILSIP